MKWFLILMLVSVPAQAITVDQLFDRHGKKRVVDFVSKKLKGKTTIFINGDFQKAHAPSLEYVTNQTMRIDLNRIALTADDLNVYFINEDKLKESKARKEAERKQSKEYRLARQKRLRDESLYREEKHEREKAASQLKRRTLAKNKISAKYQVGSSISARCTNKWGTDYRMVKYCVNKQQSALSKLQQGNVNTPPEISGRCAKKWGADYRMVKYCVDKQQSALNDLKGSGLYR